MGEFYYKELKIPYDVKVSKRKTIGIAISKEKGIVIKVPKGCSKNTIEEIIHKKSQWIYTHWIKIKEVNEKRKNRLYLEGQVILYLGKEYSIKKVEVKGNSIKVELKEGNLNIYVNSGKSLEEQQEKIKEKVLDWYRLRAKEVFKEITEKWAKRLGVSPGNIRVKLMKSLWGSCSYSNNLNYNLRLIMAPKEVIEYIVIHELCHVLEKNHSTRFWNLVSSEMPNYKEKRLWLKHNGYKLDFDYIY